MAMQADNTLISNVEMLAELVLAPFRAIGRFLVKAAENNPRIRALESIANMSDAELAEKGMTRVDAVQRVLGYTI